MKTFKRMTAFILLIVSLTGCGERNQSKKLAGYKFEDDTTLLPAANISNIEPWVKEGLTCWGIIMVVDKAGNPLRIKEVHVKVDRVEPGNIKLEALENVFLGHNPGCDRIAFKKGNTWTEKNGDLFKTQPEAIHFIDQKYPGLRIKQ